jgi:hypothetical protein
MFRGLFNSVSEGALNPPGKRPLHSLDRGEHVMPSDKIIITTDDVGAPENLPSLGPAGTPTIPLWWRLLSCLLVLCPPLLLIVAIANLLAVRHRDLALRHAYTSLYCYLLLASVALGMVAAMAIAAWRADIGPTKETDSPALALETFPAVPSGELLTAKDVAQRLSPMVLVVHQSRGHRRPFSGESRQCGGAAAVASAGHNGCLLITSRHVVDALSQGASIGNRVGVTLQDGQTADATVVGVHRTLDLALLSVPREKSQSAFVQPLRLFSTVEVGEQVFVIGHPEGFEFSISGGLVAQTRGADVIQISAPISPGNSGGPVYDTHGRLVAIVQSAFDKTKRPNAENLNFAVCVDDLLTAGVWVLSKEGDLAIADFAAMAHQGDSK